MRAPTSDQLALNGEKLESVSGFGLRDGFFERAAVQTLFFRGARKCKRKKLELRPVRAAFTSRRRGRMC